MRVARFVLRILSSVTIVLLSISVLRRLFGAEPLSLSLFLELLQGVDIDFSGTIGQFARIAASFTFENVTGWAAVLQCLNGIWEVVKLPVTLIVDFFDFISSVVKFIIGIVGVDFFGYYGAPSTGPGGGGFGGGGMHGT